MEIAQICSVLFFDILSFGVFVPCSLVAEIKSFCVVPCSLTTLIWQVSAADGSFSSQSPVCFSTSCEQVELGSFAKLFLSVALWMLSGVLFFATGFGI